RDLRLAEVDAVVGGVLRLVDHRRRVQQRLGGNAADVEADAAELRVAFDQHGVEAEVGGAERGRVAAGAGTEDDDGAFDVGLAAGGGRGLGRGRLVVVLLFVPLPACWSG